MTILDVIVSAVVAWVVLVLATTAVNMAAAELQGRLDGVCFLMLRLARRRLPADLRGPLHDEEWVPELHHILGREQERPITRLVQGLAFSLGFLPKTRSVATEVGDSRSTPSETDGVRGPFTVFDNVLETGGAASVKTTVRIREGEVQASAPEATAEVITPWVGTARAFVETARTAFITTLSFGSRFK